MKRSIICPLAMLFASCLPEVDDRPSTIDSPRILAVIAEPPEAAPGETVRFHAVVAGAEGALDDAQVYWSLCVSPKPPAENNAVNQACWDQSYKPVAGPGADAEIALPEDACELFGPEVASAALRPPDPDATGGYYQPIRVAIPERAGFGFQRLRCALTNASIDTTLAFTEQYRANRNPIVVGLETLVDAKAATEIGVGQTVALTLHWEEGAAERFVVYDRANDHLVEATETLRVSWFATAGEFDGDATEGSGQQASNGWRAPSTPGTVTFWAVLRDSRGGAAVATAVRSVTD